MWEWGEGSSGRKKGQFEVSPGRTGMPQEMWGLWEMSPGEKGSPQVLGPSCDVCEGYKDSQSTWGCHELSLGDTARGTREHCQMSPGNTAVRPLSLEDPGMGEGEGEKGRHWDAPLTLQLLLGLAQCVVCLQHCLCLCPALRQELIQHLLGLCIPTRLRHGLASLFLIPYLELPSPWGPCPLLAGRPPAAAAARPRRRGSRRAVRRPHGPGWHSVPVPTQPAAPCSAAVMLHRSPPGGGCTPC